MADVAGFYRAFGLRVAPGERPDHVAAELEFYGWLQAREAQARARGETEGAEVCRDARRKFLRDHLGRWLPLLAARLRERGAGFHARVAELAAALVAREARDLGVEPEPTAPPVPHPEPECFNCPGLQNLHSLPTEAPCRPGP
jgi:TorA maturation chaperone TorD